MNRKMILGGLVAATMVGSAPVYAQSAGQFLKNGALGAGAGAIGGAVLGVGAGTGALVGAGAGAAITALKHNHHYYHDRYGRRYHLDRHGRRIYRR